MLRLKPKSTLVSLILGSMIMFTSLGCDATQSVAIEEEVVKIVNDEPLIPNIDEILTVNTEIANDNDENVLVYYENGIESDRVPLIIDSLHDGEIIVFFTTLPDLTLTQIEKVGEFSIGIYRSGARTEVELIRALQTVNATQNVIFAEPNYKSSAKIGSVKQLQSFSDNSWANDKIALSLAHQTTQGSSDVIVAVIDTGIDINHNDLSTHLWVNSNEVINNIDDDGNGFIDDINGFDFINRDANIEDDNSHGTHVAGIVSYVAPNVKIMALKALNQDGESSSRAVFSAINYAIANNADIINLSFGGRGFNRLLRNAVRRAERAGITIIAAAGNDGSDNDRRRGSVFPASFRNSNIIAVAASDVQDNLASFSNFGSRNVDISAPGVEISSSVPGNSYASLSGTSMATPYITATAALLKSIELNLSPDQIKSALLEKSDVISVQNNLTASGSRLNIASVISEVEEPQIRELTVEEYSPEGVGVEVESEISVRFSSSVSQNEISPFIHLLEAGQEVPFTLSVRNSRVTITPNQLLFNTLYEVRVDKSFTSRNGEELLNDISFSFTTKQDDVIVEDDNITIEEPDEPEIPNDEVTFTTTPSNNANDVNPFSPIQFRFEIELTTAQIQDIDVRVLSAGNTVSGSLAYATQTLTFTPNSALAFDSEITVSMVQSTLGIDTSFSFTTQEDTSVTPFSSKSELGNAIFHDTTLSKFENMSCATCHEDSQAFIDNRANRVGGALSLGSDEVSFGGRNAPTVNYARFVPNFRFDARNNRFSGGQFRDGRASTLEEQAKGPFLDPNEMMMPDAQSVVDKIQENAVYAASFKALYNATIFDDTDRAYDAVADAIATFERSDEISPFDSKYDRFLAGTATLTTLEERGRTLFFEPRGANCRSCHSLGGRNQTNRNELFTNHQFTNIGVPKNTQALLARGDSANTVDHGLLGRADITNNNVDGFFRIPTLRNIAVTRPYMHNGVFQNLRTVIEFYNHRAGNGNGINPETNQAWRGADVSATVDTRRLRMRRLSGADMDALEAFLRTLTDARYE
jgi:cytochrome c peroxidase